MTSEYVNEYLIYSERPVTGGNKGIGFAIVENLAKVFNGNIYLAARDEDRGRTAMEKLHAKGLHNVKFCKVDLLDKTTLENARKMFKLKYGGLDILINNAGMAFKDDDTSSFDIQASVTMDTNFHGQLSVCDVMFPILRSGARVVHLSSLCSASAFRRCSDERKKLILACNTIESVVDAMNEFVRQTKENTHSYNGWTSCGYGISKLGVSMVTPIQQRIMDGDIGRKDIVINACCPGYVDTDMTNHKGTKTPDQGADTPVYLATLEPYTQIRGKYVTERKVEDCFKWE